MVDAPADPWADRVVGYCTNVHAGATLAETKSNLDRYATKVRQLACPGAPLAIGLWLSANAAEELVPGGPMEPFRDWLHARDLQVFTMNGFPYHDFHQPVVKHAVYEPNWSTQARQQYTMDLLTILCELSADAGEGSVSTLPIGWHDWAREGASHDGPTAHLHGIVEYAGLIEERDGRLMHVDLEPEPGCAIGTSIEILGFFQDCTDLINFESKVLRHLRVCHDICHAAVMFEDQAEMFRRYDSAGIKVGKVQVSNAIRVDFDALSPAERPEALRQLKAFEEDRYLHQTCIRDNASGEITFHEDLPLATRAAEKKGEPTGEWRIHFHVPIYLESFGLLGTTRNYIDDCLDLMAPRHETRHFEVETYAWNVLPPELKNEDLAEGIAHELIWLRERMGTK